ncbi:MAG: bifunctional oligoribonuclease/PAP phosphatase NrnA [Chitinivibrionales bacterium]|nr:bifunctional oligoribonuclease/PAP phosphatase NrnA [Chitinivibrionales bacterium]
MIWSELYTIIDNNKSFLISSHVNPDGDCICSELALLWYISSRGKQALIYNHDPVPTKFAFLQGADTITQQHPAHTFDVFITLDSSNPMRLGWHDYENIAPIIVNIDHHCDNTYVGTLNIVDITAAATSQMLYDFFTAMSVSFPPHIAEILYAGILTDTGGFQFSNTTSTVLRVCANLIDQGANPSTLYRRIYSMYAPNGLLLRSRVWSTLAFYCNDKICTMEMPLHLIEECNANYGDIEGMADLALTAKGVVVGMFIKYSDTNTHFSLRSNGSINVGRIAQKIAGGGGHTCAAGCTINAPMPEARRQMLQLLCDELD